MLMSCCLAICTAGYCFFLLFLWFYFVYFCSCLLLDVGRRPLCRLQIVWSMLAVVALSRYVCCLWFAILVHLWLVCWLVLGQTCTCSVVTCVSCVLLWLWCCLRCCCCLLFFLNEVGRVVLAEVSSNRSTSLCGSRRRYRCQFTMVEMCLVGIFLPICFLEHQEFTSP